MNAGKLKEEVGRLENSFTTRVITALVLVVLGAATVSVQILIRKDALNLITLFGVILVALGFIVVWTLWHLPLLRRTLSSYNEVWRDRCWTRENFAEHILPALPVEAANVSWTVRFAYDLIQKKGLGPYSREALFFVTHDVNSFEVRQGLSLGLMSLIGHGCLIKIVGSERYVWSPDVRDRFASLFPIPDDWQPPHDP